MTSEDSIVTRRQLLAGTGMAAVGGGAAAVGYHYTTQPALAATVELTADTLSIDSADGSVTAIELLDTTEITVSYENFHQNAGADEFDVTISLEYNSVKESLFTSTIDAGATPTDSVTETIATLGGTAIPLSDHSEIGAGYDLFEPTSEESSKQTSLTFHLDVTSATEGVTATDSVTTTVTVNKLDATIDIGGSIKLGGSAP